MSLSFVHTSDMTKPGSTNRVFGTKTSSSGISDAKQSVPSTWMPASKIKKSNEIKGIVDFIQNDPKNGPLQSIVQKVQKRQHLMASLYEALEANKLQNLIQIIEPGTIDSKKTLVLQVPHGTSAAKLQQRLPSLLNYLRQAGWDIEVLRIKIKPQQSAKRSQATPLPNEKKLSDSAKNALASLFSKLPKDSRLLPELANLLKKIK